MESIGRTGVSHQDLQRYFDDDLTGSENQELVAQFESEPALKAELEQLELLRGLVVRSSQAQAELVPQARFEQVWSEVERAIERDAREERAQRVSRSVWGRLWGAVKPLRVPVLAAAGVAAAAVLVVAYSDLMGNVAPSQIADASPRDVTAADETSSEQAIAATPPRAPVPRRPSSGAGALELEEPVDDGVQFTPPKPGDAELHNVEFAGRNGRVAQTGTVTVLYVEEEVEPKDSERSL